jgi:hypothetical protein
VGLCPAAVVRLEGPLAHGLAPSRSVADRAARRARLGWTTPRDSWCDAGETAQAVLARKWTTHEVSTVRIDPRRGQTGDDPPPTPAGARHAEGAEQYRHCLRGGIVACGYALLSCRLEPKRCGHELHLGCWSRFFRHPSTPCG